jgi:hypothetical protein
MSEFAKEQEETNIPTNENQPESTVPNIEADLATEEYLNEVPEYIPADQSEVEAAEAVEIPRINYRHPHQVLTNKEMRILLTTKEEDQTENDKLAIKMLTLRLKNHRSRPKPLSSAERTKRKTKRKLAKASRKANRV